MLLIFDEVITGFGRMGTPFATQKFNVKPDIITMAKALTNGAIPMGGVAVTDEVYDTIMNASPNEAIEFFHGYTYSAHPAACAAGIAAQKIYATEGLFEQAAALEDYFLDAIWTLQDHPLVADIRGIGLMAGVEYIPTAFLDGVVGKCKNACSGTGFMSNGPATMPLLHQPLSPSANMSMKSSTNSEKRSMKCLLPANENCCQRRRHCRPGRGACALRAGHDVQLITGGPAPTPIVGGVKLRQMAGTH